MGTAGISFGNITEIVFENRFRTYGAYMLRKTYSDRLMISMIISISAVVMLISAPLIIQLFKEEEIVIDTTPKDAELKVIEIDLAQPKTEAPKEEPAKPKEAPAPPVKGVSSNIVVSNTPDPQKAVILTQDSLQA